MTAAPRVLALATLLAVGAQTLSIGGADGRQATSGVERYSKLDRFLHDRMGLPGVFGGGVGNRSGPPSPTTDRGLLSRAVAPEDEDDGNADNEEDGDDDDDDDDDEPRDDDELRDDEQEDEEDEVTPEPFVRLRHRSAGTVAAERNFGAYGKVIMITIRSVITIVLDMHGYQDLLKESVTETRQCSKTSYGINTLCISCNGILYNYPVD